MRDPLKRPPLGFQDPPPKPRSCADVERTPRPLGPSSAPAGPTPPSPNSSRRTHPPYAQKILKNPVNLNFFPGKPV